ncbi:acyl-CoA dehydrogenase family protein [Streptomyces tirandamycinicus]|uniref:acyl-CoA dehydrogenase family protein n=1 Tax=Streptomyces tirandamycinicus TaxID=2174846 RepID=UPI002270B5C8|nr:acyl-CoA dehydrogenase [Streptomyces tirandamycinicus]MCY0982119.1 acyl-CoA dehydrogenase [Streptomyces tirandamycinicus]
MSEPAARADGARTVPGGLASSGLDALPPTADGAAVWAALGEAGGAARAYRDGSVRAGVDPDGLGAVLAALDARFSIAATLSASVQLATALPVLATGTGPVVEGLLERALAGRATVALAATDETAGTDLAGLRTRARFDGDAVEVTGEKRWIANATTAEAFLVLARHREGRHFTHFTWILVPADAPGVKVRAADSALFAGSGAGHVEFDGVRLPRDHVVGRVGLGLPVFARHIAAERLAGALWGVALCRRVLADTHRRLSTRAHGEGSLWDLESVRQRFAVCLVRVRELRALTDASAESVAARYDTVAGATLKAAAGATVGHVLGECAQLWGAAGFASGGMQDIRAQAALFGIGGGATEVVLGLVAEDAERILADPADPADPAGSAGVAGPAPSGSPL